MAFSKKQMKNFSFRTISCKTEKYAVFCFTY